MTAVGKILVFFNLIFSLIVGAFVVTVYISQTHWAAAYKELEQKYVVADASVAAYQNEQKKTSDYTREVNDKMLADAGLVKAAGITKEDDPAAKAKKISATLTAALADADDQKKKADAAKDDLSKAKQKLDASEAVLTGAQAEVAKRQTEAEATRKLLKEETDNNLKLVVDLGKERDQKVAWKIRADSAELRKAELEAINNQLAHDNQKLSAGGGSGALMKKDGPNPPPDSIEGVVSEVSASGLVKISLGSDAGLTKGNTLEVYRLNNKVPDQSKYLGRIKIIEVTATEAVGQPVGKPPQPLQKGDQVSSRILGG